MLVRDAVHSRAAWDYAATKGRYMLAHFESADANVILANLAWMVTHPAYSGVVELSNEPFWNGISAQSWVNSWGPVISAIRAKYPNGECKLLAPIDDWPTARSTGPGTAAWTQQLIAARPSLRTEMHGWAVHPYNDYGPQGCYDHSINAINALKANGVTNPVLWGTEIGWSRTSPTPCTEQQQADYARAFLSQTGPLYEAVFWYQMDDNPGNSVARERGFGLYQLSSNVDWTGAPWRETAVHAAWKAAAAASPSGDFRGSAPPPPPPPPAGQVTLKLDPADPTRVLVGDIPAGANHLHYYSSATNAAPGTQPYKYSDVSVTIAGFSPDPTMPWVDVIAMYSVDNTVPIGKWVSDVTGTRVQTSSTPPPPPPTSALDHRQVTGLAANALMSHCSLKAGFITDDGRKSFEVYDSTGRLLFRLRGTADDWAKLGTILGI